MVVYQWELPPEQLLDFVFPKFSLNPLVLNECFFTLIRVFSTGSSVRRPKPSTLASSTGKGLQSPYGKGKIHARTL